MFNKGQSFLIASSITTALSQNFSVHGPADAMIIRDDIEDQKYIELGEKYSPSLVYTGGCAATLIKDDWALTAAHCVKGREHSLFAVAHLGQKYRVEKVVVHPKFGLQNSPDFDLALIQLKEPVNDGIPINFYPSADEEGKVVVFVGRGGYGTGKEGLKDHDGKQRGATNTVFRVTEHLIGFEFNDPSSDSVTAMEGISGPGDSGGPAFIEKDSELYVAGVSSTQDSNGHAEATYGVHEIYARVSSSIPWFESVMEESTPASLVSHPLIDAIKTDNEILLKQTLSDDVVENDELIKEAFIQTLIHDRVSLAEELISQGADIEAASVNGFSLFEHALMNRNSDYFDMLLNRFSDSKDVHKRDSAILPLYISVLSERTQVPEPVKLLVKQGANINARDSRGDTALILAGWTSRNLQLVRYLVEQGADVNIPNENGDTPLIDAAYLGSNDIFEYLLNNGADKSIANNNGDTAMTMAIKKENSKAMQLLFAHE